MGAPGSTGAGPAKPKGHMQKEERTSRTQEVAARLSIVSSLIRIGQSDLVRVVVSWVKKVVIDLTHPD